MKPIIGIVTNYVEAHEFKEQRIRGVDGQDMYMSSMDYPESIYAAGGIPLGIIPIDSDDYLDRMIDEIDGLLLTGGADVNPELYGQPFKKGLRTVDYKRDILEMKLLKKAYKKDIPIFGICRGFQLINVFFGGTLIQDIDNYFDTSIEHLGLMAPRYSFVHKVNLIKGSNIRDCFNQEIIQVNSFHHQIVDSLGKDLEVSGISEDGVVEAYFHPKKPHIFAVQWHPEMMANIHKKQLKVFEMFIDYATNKSI
ncbi:gamma-glutamyl-gamma-aminobutyrate hydrolase family protein [Clostridium sp. DL1XJH146]